MKSITDLESKIERLRAHLTHVEIRIAEYEGMAQDAKRSVSPYFSARLGDLRLERDRLIENIRKLQFEAATSWRTNDPDFGIVKVCEEIVKRINDLFDRIDKHRSQH